MDFRIFARVFMQKKALQNYFKLDVHTTSTCTYNGKQTLFAACMRIHTNNNKKAPILSGSDKNFNNL